MPQQQHWHSAPDSDHMVACPNGNACAGDVAALLSCQNATYEANLAVDQVCNIVSAFTLNLSTAMRVRGMWQRR